jgi:hypothetical protein
MANDERYIASLQWAIDRQKQDLENIRKQLRRYFLTIITIAAARLVSLTTNDNPLSQLEGSPDDSILLQMGLISKSTVSELVEFFRMFSVIYSSLAYVTLGLTLLAIVYVEYLPNCKPSYNTGEIIGRQYDYLEKWVKENDRALYSAGKARERILRIGAKAVILLIVAYAIQITAPGSPLVATFLIIASYFPFTSLFIHDEFIKGQRMSRLAASVTIWVAVLAPAILFRIIFDGIPSYLAVLWGILAIGIEVTYFWEHIQRYMSGVNNWISKRRLTSD